eukprot:TRINITY_DN13489_c0_g2_i1.p1 TRINITY_DN13489_c0_g2~~TRINITY_DN13489_c0_g2_i1.p1  ORF type:complete len:459 (-),score=72.38 TRINITY_DN13489_c0_g2_i1:175-1551(-)
MGYEGPYTLIARCGTECMGTFMAIYLGETIIANEILPGTKGHELGFGWVAFGFGMAFFLAIQFFGYISAHLNPAMCLALAIIGDISWTDWLALSVAEILGAFIGGIFVWLHYLPHFKTVPKPDVSREVGDRLFRTGDPIGDTALRLASYNPVPPPHKGQGWRGAIRDVGYYTKDTRYESEVDELLGAGYHTIVDATPTECVVQPTKVRRRSVQVADLQRRLKQQDLNQRFSWSQSGGSEKLLGGVGSAISARLHPIASTNNEDVVVETSPTSQKPLVQKDEVEQAKERIDELYKRAVVADQNGKLSIFCTRPAIYSPIFNCIVEFMGTFALVLGALLMDLRATHLCPTAKELYLVGLKSYFVGIMIMCMILGLGGPTGFAVNPARDFGPRLAHFLLPIRGKGSSEWYYAWIPVVMAFAGGAAAGGIYLALREMNITEVDDEFCYASIDFIFNSQNNSG